MDGLRGQIRMLPKARRKSSDWLVIFYFGKSGSVMTDEMAS